MDPRLGYSEAVIHGASPAALVITMYDMVVADLGRAKDALSTGDIESRTNEIKHAMLVLEHLQGSLNFENGGDCAKSLDRLYSMIRAKLLEAQLKQSAEILDDQVSLLLSVREAWQQVEQMNQAQAVQVSPVDLVPALAGETAATAQWSA